MAGSVEVRTENTWFGQAAAQYRLIVDKDGHFNVKALLEVAPKTAEAYDHLFSGGIVSKILKDDIKVNSGGLKNLDDEVGGAIPLLHDLIADELKRKGGKAKVRTDMNSGTVCGLWYLRALLFIARFVELTTTKPEANTAPAARQTYDEVLRPYHGFLKGGVVATAMAMAPSREGLFKNMNTTEAEALPEMHQYCKDVLPVLRAIEQWFRDQDLWFPDKL